MFTSSQQPIPPSGNNGINVINNVVDQSSVATGAFVGATICGPVCAAGGALIGWSTAKALGAEIDVEPAGLTQQEDLFNI